MKIDVLDAVRDASADEAWKLYRAAFADLEALAVQRHLMYRSEFDEVMADERVQKYLALDNDGTLLGLATYTNQLDAMPLISPAYFQRRWPEHYAAGRIWYCGFVAVAPTAQGSGVFAELVKAMYRVAEAQDGVIGLDICRYNNEVHHLARAIRMLLGGVSGGRVSAQEADAQAFMIYETAAGVRHELVLDLADCDPKIIGDPEAIQAWVLQRRAPGGET